MKLAAVERRSDVRWVTSARSVEGTCDGVAFAIKSRWWGPEVTVVAESPFPVPEPMLIYISARGMDHGFWRDLLVGDAAFDNRYFVFSDMPALLPIVIGEATRKAMRDEGPHFDDIVLYVRDGVVQTTSTNVVESDPTMLDRHVAVHRALAADHRAFLERWRDAIADAQGRAELAWPPTALLLRPTGALEVRLLWAPPASREADWDAVAASLCTEVLGRDDRKRARWSFREVGATEPCTHLVGERRFKLVGRVPLSLDMLGDLIERARITAIACEGSELAVTLRGIPSASRMETAVRIVQLVVDATSVDSGFPYR